VLIFFIVMDNSSYSSIHPHKAVSLKTNVSVHPFLCDLNHMFFLVYSIFDFLTGDFVRKANITYILYICIVHLCKFDISTVCLLNLKIL
jgi:hypothetical protein